jgi:alpha-ketoglutarate-dependent taurine dioxygenase
MGFQHIEIRPLAGALGAEVGGIDLSQCGDEAIAEVRQALLDNLVLCFREQQLSPAQQIALGRRFGELNIHPHYRSLDGYPEILPVLKEPTDKRNIGGVWHSDVTFLERPALGSLLYAIDVPSKGGDTMFASQYTAYEALSDGMKRMLEGLIAVHSDAILTEPAKVARSNAERSTKLNAAATQVSESEHPVVRTHPETGRKALFVNGAFTQRFKDMTAEESRPLLHYLFRHAARPEFTCRIRWQKGSLVFWDNRAVQHYALNDYPGERREMHRVTVEGDRPH